MTLSVLASLVLAASCHEAWRLNVDRPIDAKEDSLAIRYLHCFSLINNGNNLLSTKAPPLACLSGLREYYIAFSNFNYFIVSLSYFVGVLSTTWVVMYHSYSILKFQSLYNLYQLYNVKYCMYT